MIPSPRAPITRYYIESNGRRSNWSSTQYNRVLKPTAVTPHRRPSRMEYGFTVGMPKSTVATVNIGPVPMSQRWMVVASVLAMTSGMNERDLYSNNSSSMARMTAAIAVPKFVAIPAAAPHASKTCRSDPVVWINWPINEPNNPPVWMIGRSALKALHVPIAMRPTQRKYEHLLDGVQEACLIALASGARPAGHQRWSLRWLAKGNDATGIHGRTFLCNGSPNNEWERNKAMAQERVVYSAR